MNKPLVIANWKCNPTTKIEARNLFKNVNEAVKDLKNIEVVICPPFVWLEIGGGKVFSEETVDISKNIKLGAQNCFWEKRGAYTGEISPLMLTDAGCEYVIVGHSERRNYFNETDELINLKIKAVLEARLKPILCIGEREEEKEIIKDVLEKQLSGALRDLSASQISKMVIAYEPIWAIGTGKFCSPEDTFSAGLIIKKLLINVFGKVIAENVRVVYGGSVDNNNALSYIKEAKMDGLLVGGASLSAGEFSKIVTNIAEFAKEQV